MYKAPLSFKLKIEIRVVAYFDPSPSTKKKNRETKRNIRNRIYKRYIIPLFSDNILKKMVLICAQKKLKNPRIYVPKFGL